MKKQKAKNISLRILGTIALPLVMFLILVIVSAAKGVDFVTKDSFNAIAKGSCYAALIAMALSTQILNGRFDFSGGVTVILSAYLAGNIVEKYAGNNVPLYILLCIVFAVTISMVTAVAYRYLKMPMMICSIALTLFYESLTKFFFNGVGAQIYKDVAFVSLAEFKFAWILLFVGIIIYFYFKDLSPYGTQARLLSNNQLTSVNIGINENKNMYITFVVSGLLYGLAAVIYGAMNWIKPEDISSLSTTSVAFSNIVPVYIGMFIGLLSYGWVGVLAGAITIQMLNRGLNVIANDTTGYYNIFFGLFMIIFWTLSAELDNIKRLTQKIKEKISSSKNKVESK